MADPEILRSQDRAVLCLAGILHKVLDSALGRRSALLPVRLRHRRNGAQQSQVIQFDSCAEFSV